MQVRRDSKNGALVASPAETLEAFQVQTQNNMEHWIQQLQADPDGFTDVEQQIDQHYRRGGGQLIASILATVTQTPQMEQCIGQVRRNAAIPLRAAQPRTLQVRLLCGLVLWLTTAYCAPRRTPTDGGSEQLTGLYPELAAFGFGKGCSPALQYKVARIVALSPSIEVARQELRREGIVLDKKTVRRMAEQLGQQLLELRRRELFAWREGWLPAGNDFAGRRVAVQIDGGRVRLRENKPQKKHGKKKKGSRGKFDTPWREAVHRTTAADVRQPLRRGGIKIDGTGQATATWGEQRGVEGDSLFGATRIGRPLALRDVSPPRRPLWQRGDRKHNSSRHQP